MTDIQLTELEREVLKTVEVNNNSLCSVIEQDLKSRYLLAQKPPFRGRLLYETLMSLKDRSLVKLSNPDPDNLPDVGSHVTALITDAGRQRLS